MIESPSNSWGEDIEEELERLRITCLLRSKYHKNSYFKMLYLLKNFRIPTIILSSANSVFNVALIPYMVQEHLSLLCCFISLFVGLISSIELFLQIQKRMEIDLMNAKDFYLISIDICKILNLDKGHRNCNGRTFLDDKYNLYRHLVETSIVTDREVHDNIIALTLIDDLSENEKIDIVNGNISASRIMDARVEYKPTKNFLNNFSIPISTSASRRTSYEKPLNRKVSLGEIGGFNEKTGNIKSSLGADDFFIGIDKSVDEINKSIDEMDKRKKVDTSNIV